MEDWVDRLRRAVEAKGKQSVVAEEADVDPSALSDILRRETADPKLQTLIRICRACNVTVGWVLGETGFELGESDYDFLGKLSDWAARKRDLRVQQEAAGMSHPSRVMQELPAVATPRGETFFDEDEIRDRTIPLEYQNEGANGVFRTRGDSMIDAGIFEGDVLFVKKTTNPRVANRRIIVGRLDGTFTVKRLRIEKGVTTLVSERPAQPEVTILQDDEAERFRLIGVVVGLSRDYFRQR
jgi:SOS-response transcriptional repressor LexA